MGRRPGGNIKLLNKTIIFYDAIVRYQYNRSTADRRRTDGGHGEGSISKLRVTGSEGGGNKTRF